ncbi:MAG: hypothetical protein ABI679_08285 [Gemmatimonadota bacterium]
MFKPLLGVAATGIAAVLAWKLMAIVMLPLLGLAIGFVALMIKLVVVFFVLVFAFWLLRRSSHSESIA